MLFCRSSCEIREKTLLMGGIGTSKRSWLMICEKLSSRPMTKVITCSFWKYEFNSFTPPQVQLPQVHDGPKFVNWSQNVFSFVKWTLTEEEDWSILCAIGRCVDCCFAGTILEIKPYFRSWIRKNDTDRYILRYRVQDPRDNNIFIHIHEFRRLTSVQLVWNRASCQLVSTSWGDPFMKLSLFFTDNARLHDSIRHNSLMSRAVRLGQVLDYLSDEIIRTERIIYDGSFVGSIILICRGIGICVRHEDTKDERRKKN